MFSFRDLSTLHFWVCSSLSVCKPHLTLPGPPARSVAPWLTTLACSAGAADESGSPRSADFGSQRQASQGSGKGTVPTSPWLLSHNSFSSCWPVGSPSGPASLLNPVLNTFVAVCHLDECFFSCKSLKFSLLYTSLLWHHWNISQASLRLQNGIFGNLEIFLSKQLTPPWWSRPWAGPFLEHRKSLGVAPDFNSLALH